MTASLFPEFADGKDPRALRTIGEVSRALGIASHVLRYWEQQFPMLQPLKRSGGRRYYRAEDVALVETIHRLVNREGYTLRGARQALKENAAPQMAEPVDRSGAADIRSRLSAIRQKLAESLEG